MPTTDFVKRKADAFPNLKVDMVDGARPYLQLLREGEDADSATEFVNVRGWKSDEIRDFIALKLGTALGLSRISLNRVSGHFLEYLDFVH